MQSVKSWKLPVGADESRANLLDFANVTFSIEDGSLKVTGEGVVPARVAGISAEVLRVFAGATPNGLSLRGASGRARPPPPSAASRDAARGGARAAG